MASKAKKGGGPKTPTQAEYDDLALELEQQKHALEAKDQELKRALVLMEQRFEQRLNEAINKQQGQQQGQQWEQQGLHGQQGRKRGNSGIGHAADGNRTSTT